MPWFWMILVSTKNRGSKKQFNIENSLQIFETPNRKTQPSCLEFAFRPLNVNNEHLTTTRNTEKYISSAFDLKTILPLFSLFYIDQKQRAPRRRVKRRTHRRRYGTNTPNPAILRGKSLEMVKKSTSKQRFFPNHVDFDFHRYSLISASFRMYSNVKK